tara:strand:- start:16990 stop:18435 length:1446 start_codon:yes stop_codon:yes gene_type:complete
VEGAAINHIYNLIIEKDKKGKFKNHYVVGFEMEPEDIDSFFMTGEDYSQFTSTYRFYTFDSFFQDSKLKRVGKSGDCGSGTTGGSGDIQYNAPGTTLTNSYNGHIITTTFSNTTVSTTYNYNSTIVSNGTVNTVSTVATSGVVQVATNGPSAPIYTQNVSSGTAQVSSSYNPQGSGGTPCTNTTTTHPDGGFTIKLCAVPDNNSNKSTLTAYGSDCTNGSGTFAINTAAKPVYKLSAALQGILTFGQFEWFTDAQHTERLSFASELVWFLIDNGNTNENIEITLRAINDLMDNYSLVSFKPLVKYPLTSNYANTYPKLTEFLKVELPKIIDNTKVIDAINDLTDVPKETIKESLKWGKGPEVRIEQLHGDGDNAKLGSYRGHVVPELKNVLFLDIDLVNSFENSTNTEFSDAMAFLIAVTILHEYTHLGDNLFGNNYWGNTWVESGFNNENEAGILFEEMVFDERVEISNAGVILKRTGGL